MKFALELLTKLDTNLNEKANNFREAELRGSSFSKKDSHDSFISVTASVTQPDVWEHIEKALLDIKRLIVIFKDTVDEETKETDSDEPKPRSSSLLSVADDPKKRLKRFKSISLPKNEPQNSSVLIIFFVCSCVAIIVVFITIFFLGINSSNDE